MAASQRTELTRHTIGAVILMVLWTVGIAASLVWNKLVHERETETFVLIEARAIIYKDIVYRNWISLKDGVYAAVSEHSPPNPYLKVPERDIVFPSGKVYTLINPAYMTRQVLELQNRDRHILGHITSLHPLRPENAPDEWERAALIDCERGAKEVSVRQRINDVDYQRLMMPLMTDQSCMPCHAQQGYRVGTVRGGISVSIPLAPYRETGSGHFRVIAGAHGGIWLFGMTASLFWFRITRRRVRERARHQAELLVRDTALAASSSAVLLTDPAGIVTYANAMTLRMWRLTAADALVGRPVFDLLEPLDAGDIIEQVKDMGSWFGEITARRPDGTEFYVLASAAPVHDGAEALEAFTFSFSDISMRKSAELALRESREALRQRNEVMEKDLQIAQMAQREMLTMQAPRSPVLETGYRYLPVEKVGGDFFSFTQTRENELGIFIGDVSGHGVAAALFHALIKRSIDKVERQYFDTPAAYLERLNRELFGHMTSYFVTAVYGFFRRVDGEEGVRFVFANAGHPTPLVVRAAGDVESFGARGMVIGAEESVQYAEESVLLHAGDMVLLYTDGVPETENAAGRMLGYDEDLQALVSRARRDSCDETLDALVAALNEYRSAVPFGDDILLIGLRVRPDHS